MALSRKTLEGMGLDEKQIEAIIEAHGDTVSALKAARDKAQEEAKKVPDLQRQLEEAKAASGNGSEWEEKFNDEHQAFEDFKAQVELEKKDAEKAQAYRGMLAKAGIDPKRIDSIMRVTDLSDVSMKDGELEDAEKLEEGAKKEWADFVIKTVTRKADPADPPKNDHGIEGADPDVVKRIQEQHERRWGKATEAKEQ